MNEKWQSVIQPLWQSNDSRGADWVKMIGLIAVQGERPKISPAGSRTGCVPRVGWQSTLKLPPPSEARNVRDVLASFPPMHSIYVCGLRQMLVETVPEINQAESTWGWSRLHQVRPRGRILTSKPFAMALL